MATLRLMRRNIPGVLSQSIQDNLEIFGGDSLRLFFVTSIMASPCANRLLFELRCWHASRFKESTGRLDYHQLEIMLCPHFVLNVVAFLTLAFWVCLLGFFSFCVCVCVCVYFFHYFHIIFHTYVLSINWCCSVRNDLIF